MRLPIPLHPRYGGALNWFDHLDEAHRVRLEFIDRPYPPTPALQERWLIHQLREDCYQNFFFEPLAHRGLALDFQAEESVPRGSQRFFWTTGTVPLAQLFLLPNENPAEELDQMKAFLTWVQDQVTEQGNDERDARIQWFRGGRERGLEAAGFEDKSKQAALTQALQKWREHPWFDAWYRANLRGLGKVRRGPHCWLAMPSLLPQRLPTQQDTHL